MSWYVICVLGHAPRGFEILANCRRRNHRQESAQISEQQVTHILNSGFHYVPCVKCFCYSGTAIDEDFKASVIFHFPGAYDLNRIVNYPGEDKFGGQIGYGMGSGHGGLFVFDKDMKGKRAAVRATGIVVAGHVIAFGGLAVESDLRCIWSPNESTISFQNFVY